jgi:hypothetical protein
MTDALFADNDIALKACVYGFDETIIALFTGNLTVCVLGTAQYVLRKRVRDKRKVTNTASASKSLEAFLATASVVEPTEDDINTAADIEVAAQQIGVPLDSGESLLLALLIAHSSSRLVTGDKRAILALESLVATLSILESAAGRIGCLEQLMLLLVHKLGAQSIRKGICAEPLADKALSICFSCSSPDGFSEENVAAGLKSYINSLQSQAPQMLCSDPDLSAWIS